MLRKLFSKVGGLQPATILKSELFREFRLILRNNFFKKHLSVAASKHW